MCILMACTSSIELSSKRKCIGGLETSCRFKMRNICWLLAGRGRKFGRISTKMLLLAVLFLIYFVYFGVKMHLYVILEDAEEETKANSVPEQWKNVSNYVTKQPKKPHRQRYSPCEVPFLDSVTYLQEPEDNVKLARFSLRYLEREQGILPSEARFGGHQKFMDREKSFRATNQTIHCGFVRGPDGFPSTGFDLDEEDKKFMNACKIVVSSCIFGSFDFLRRPTSKLISEYSKKNVCFVMFVDAQTLAKLSSEGNIPDERGNIGLWRIVVVKNLPYEDMRKTGKVPKFLSHRLFPSSRYSIWVDSKLRLNADPMLIIEYFLWRAGSEYAISNHYTRHCVWEEVLQNKRLNKYNHSVIDEQFHFYQSDGLTKYDLSDPDIHLPSFVPEGSFIVRAHTAMSNLFSCLWFNEVDRFTSRDQLSFAYTYLKLRRLNPDKPLYLNMFKDCERRGITKLFHHRAEM
ncbi:probable hexosyltransferase MUCI70 isoform X2 [Salvia hispanica]|uniref:probable hexosyltransferase MUCI70 isoform X2 n=1 Tax=Salvia hispanica TaxID=49212 RepID=UPI0020095504|nr:probable hexosyltransferase MUCI70 isoform X2 [Salvia hispanica]